MVPPMQLFAQVMIEGNPMYKHWSSVRHANNFILGTHDVQNATATYSVYPTERMDISCFFVKESTNPGFFIIVATNNPILTYRAVRRNASGPITNVSIPGQFENAAVFGLWFTKW